MKASMNHVFEIYIMYKLIFMNLFFIHSKCEKNAHTQHRMKCLSNLEFCFFSIAFFQIRN